MNINKREEFDIISRWKTNDIMVSICCITFNHEEYIGQAIDSFLMQETDFPFEIIISDDCSTDGTADIVSKYQTKYPNIIKPIFQTENQFTKGVKLFTDITMPKSRGKYIALCEGDDYWIDPHKLKKQVDFLEQNLQFMGCVHNTRYLENDLETDKLVIENVKEEYTFFDIIDNYIHTSSYLFRYDCQYKRDIDQYLKLYYGDRYHLLVFSKFGPVKCIDEVMSVYRIHDMGFCSGANKKVKYLRELEDYLAYSKAFQEHEDFFLKLFLRSLYGMDSDYIDAVVGTFSTELDHGDAMKIAKYLMVSIADNQKVISEYSVKIKECNDYIQYLESENKDLSFIKYIKKIMKKIFSK
ncbi:glycosyltransferase [Francisella noatunensis]|uniref:Glycosyltransferase n=1 Tax=Francisella noatunensis TaxID=657445 RepID=A0A9Q2KVE4_9GAMM|nr:glycosyltransferase [Francisella noatunensis]MBK2028548.1 glycosyltransferase [Francisella noatunensis]MBK2034203.1 glycosyltransferase [Francisella noatunensis]MBK2048512.1 glycosyltransferase [Francisella noatunensis]MBK2050714.1 glycosyltransferase [Francisella noatunensis]MBK2051778.1 glycosyltransferase [Francisella noatunensis]